MKKILGLDLGTNSIGWALIEINHETKTVKILGLGSRIIPMNSREIKDFESQGKVKSTAAQRREDRGKRRLIERFKLRRDRLHLVLNLLNALPKHYQLEIEFENKKGKRCGKFKGLKEPKLAYLPKQKGEKAEFLFKESYQEMLDEIGIENKKGKRIPYDWTLYYLRDKALKTKEQLEKENKKPLTLEEFAWVLLSYNQKRGYEKTEASEEIHDLSKKLEEFGITKSIFQQIDTGKIEIVPLSLNATEVSEIENNCYTVTLSNGYSYKEYSNSYLTEIKEVDEIKIVEKLTFLNENGNDIDHSKTIYKIEDVFKLKVENVVKRDKNYIKIYNNGWEVSSRKDNDFVKFKKANTTIEEEILVTRLYNEEGELIKPSFKKDSFTLNVSKNPMVDFKLLDPSNGSNWKLLKKKTEKEALTYNVSKNFINKNGGAKKYISPKIYQTLKEDAVKGIRTKIIGGLFQVVGRDFYREELNDIVKNQQEIHSQLNDRKYFEQCVKLLYPQNEKRRRLLQNKAIQHLLVEDILLYQRPLKSKKSEIGNCKYEIKYWKKLKDKQGNVIEEVDEETREPKLIPVYQKAASASHPYYQEFRIWDKLHNLKIIQVEKEVNGKKETNIDVTNEYIKTQGDWQKLFDELNNRKSLNQKQFLDFCKKEYGLPYNKKEVNFTWNFPKDEELTGNETRVSFALRFKKCGFTNYQTFLTQEKEYNLWHYLYSVSYQERNARDKKSLHTFFNNFLDGCIVDNETKEKIIDNFANYPKFPSKYGAYSEKALKKLLPLINRGINKTYHWENEQWYLKWRDELDQRKQEIIKRLQTIDFSADTIDYSKAVETDVHSINGEIPYPKGLFNAFKDVKSVEEFKNLNLTKAQYLVYGRHSELAQAKYWTSPNQIRKELHQELKHNSLNNPIAEKLLVEMMKVVADIWEEYGKKDDEKNYKKLFDEIHVEVGRELKKSAKEKEKETKRQKENRIQNKRIRQILKEFLTESNYGANPEYTEHFERLKIVEEGATKCATQEGFFEDEKLKKKGVTKKWLDSILQGDKIEKKDFEKYKLWLEQGYKSPYTGRIIKLTDLFNGAKYNIDHIFPEAKVTNNSLSNKVVCEREVNKEKSDLTGRAFIQSKGGSEIYCSAHGKKIKILDEDKYIDIVKNQFSGAKRTILLAKEIPAGFTNSQLNNARHISRKAMELLSHIVREEGEVEFRSKNVLPVTGAVTKELKKAWRLNEVWRELVQPRFERMNKLTKSNLFGQYVESNSGTKYFNCKIDDSILEKSPSYDIKRIDHRHHALDALIIALCTQDHVNYINNINADAKSDNVGKQKRIEEYRKTLKRKIKYKSNKKNSKEKDWLYMLPGEKRIDNAESSKRDSVIKMNYQYKDQNFGDEFNYKKMVLTALQDTIVTFKQNLRVINKRVNYYKNSPNNITWQEPRTFKDIPNSENQYNWGVRRSLGKDTYYGKVYLGETENKQLYKYLSKIYNYPEIIIDDELQKQIIEIKNHSKNFEEFKDRVKKDLTDKKVEVKVIKMAKRYPIDTSFDSKKIKTIADAGIKEVKGIRKILLNHLKQFDTVELPFDEAIKYYDALMEKDKFEAIVKDPENNFSLKDELINYLINNDYKLDKSDYKSLNVLVEKVTTFDFRNDKTYKIKEHPEIAFTPEEIENMNQPENLKLLNGGKNHAPIKKVRISSGFGNQRPVSENKNSVKSKQYVVNDEGSNLYLGVYEPTYFDNEGNKSKRLFKDIRLIELIETLKIDPENRFHPLPEVIYDDHNDEYKRIFTLSPLDLVYVPTHEEREKQNIDIHKLDKNRIYKYVDGGFDNKGKLTANFIPYSVSQPLWAFHNKKRDEIFEILSREKKIKFKEKNDLIQDEFGLGSQQTKNQKSIDEIMVKYTCWKLEVDRLGNILKIIR